MEELKLSLSSNIHKNIAINMMKKDEVVEKTLLYNYLTSSSECCVFNDESYSICVEFDTAFENIANIAIDKLYINSEIVGCQFNRGFENNVIQNAFYWENRQNECIFLESFGVAQIEIIVNGISYISENISVMVNKKRINDKIINMVDYIYENCDKYLYDNHKYPKTVFESKLLTIKGIYDVYLKYFKLFKNSPQKKLVQAEKIGAFSKLQTITPNAMRFISTHPEELSAVNYNSGIKKNKQYYQPQNTMVSSASYSVDVYENQIIVGFIKTIIDELKKMDSEIEAQSKFSYDAKEKDGYIESVHYIYAHSKKAEQKATIKCLSDIRKLSDEFQQLYFDYLHIFKVRKIAVCFLPKYTNVFRSIMPYRLVYEKIVDWFNFANSNLTNLANLTKENLVLNFISTSKIYEYFCLLKINSCLEKIGFANISGALFPYEETRFYTNSRYNNTFVFTKDSTVVTVYYQPIIYSEKKTKEQLNNLMLYRNTEISINKVFKGGYYVPDYVIKIQKDSQSKYYILDAKYSTEENVKTTKLPSLVFKYLFSVSTIEETDKLSGLCVICGKSDNNTCSDLHDKAENFGQVITPSALIVSLSGHDDFQGIEEMLRIFLYGNVA